jgi:hypothetical protein
MNDTDPAAKIPWKRQTPDGQVFLSMPWEIFVLGVAILSILNLVLLILLRNPDLDQVIEFMDFVLILIFLIDFLRRMHLATDTRAYLRHGYGWLDVMSIVPLLRIARVVRIAKVSRLVRRMGGPTATARVFFKDRASAGLYIVLLLALVVMEFGSIAVLWSERVNPDANITTAGDALWYSIVTMSTVGYGDKYPITEVGRLFGSGIIIVGVGVFGTLTGFLANAFIGPRSQPAADDGPAPSAAPVPDAPAPAAATPAPAAAAPAPDAPAPAAATPAPAAAAPAPDMSAPAVLTPADDASAVVPDAPAGAETLAAPGAGA